MQMSRCEQCQCNCGIDDVEAAGTVTLMGPPPQHFSYASLFQLGSGSPSTTRTEFFEVKGEYVSTFDVKGRTIVQIAPGALTKLAHLCVLEMQHFFRRDHLQGWANILNDPEATPNDKFVALQLLKNACVAAQQMLPSCQDTGTAIVVGKRGELVWTGGSDEEDLSRGIWEVYQQHNLRYSQLAATTMFEETNTRNNLPAQIDIQAVPGEEYHFLFIAKGGGSANKSYLYQQTKALLNEKSLRRFVDEKLRTLGTAACPPYHIALVIGGASAEMTMKTVKLASCRYLDTLPTTGDGSGRAFRDIHWESVVLEAAQRTNIGAQFGGKYFAHQARVIRLPRHGASCPVGLGVSCSADRQIIAKITPKGMFIERLVHDPSIFLPRDALSHAPSDVAIPVDLNQSMHDIRRQLSQYPVASRLVLNGPLVVARDIAHAKYKQQLDAGLGLPQYIKDRVIYYAGPAKTPKGFVSGSFGPTTAGRMDTYVEEFMAAGGSFVTLAKGNRSEAVTRACSKHKGFYLGSIGGAAALLATEGIKAVELLEYPELGMEAVWSISVVDFPAFIIVDDKGNDFFAQLTKQ